MKFQRFANINTFGEKILATPSNFLRDLYFKNFREKILASQPFFSQLAKISFRQNCMFYSINLNIVQFFLLNRFKGFFVKILKEYFCNQTLDFFKSYLHDDKQIKKIHYNQII
eukprot:TRINITY_DN31265_c1_g1_i1.p3 TRINITY_DN31265_c1_g1~~TRINITY_DN31265_c1_g1_i1.p3  ORF type:complete len:113 (+),score=4.95 TRINITY_DN31265_c1_g1_i1:37-375(+)